MDPIKDHKLNYGILKLNKCKKYIFPVAEVRGLMHIYSQASYTELQETELYCKLCKFQYLFSPAIKSLMSSGRMTRCSPMSR